MIYPRWKKVANGDGCLKSSRSLTLCKSQSTTLVRIKTPITVNELPRTILFIFIIVSIMSTHERLVRLGPDFWKGIDGFLYWLPFLMETMASLDLGPDFYLLAFMIIGMFFYIHEEFGTLKVDVKTLKDDVGTLKDDVKTLKDDVGTLKDDVGTLKGTAAKKKAKLSTLVIIAYDRFSNKPIGHCVLLRCRKTGYFAILSAAHILTEMRQYKKFDSQFRLESLDGEHRYEIEWNGENIPEKFIGYHYVARGQRDCGVMVVKLATCPPVNFFQKLEISQDHAFDNDFVGSCHDFRFNGAAFTKLDDVWRVGLPIPSKPGCSGTPLFCPKGRLLSLLHGVCKHRGQRHSGGTDEGKLTNHVYVDMVRNLNNLHFWGDGYDECFIRLEKLTDEDNKNTAIPLSKLPDETVDVTLASDTALKLYSKVYNKVKTNAHFVENTECFTRSKYFSINEVCDALVGYRKASAQESDPRLDDLLDSPSEHTYWAFSHL